MPGTPVCDKGCEGMGKMGTDTAPDPNRSPTPVPTLGTLWMSSGGRMLCWGGREEQRAQPPKDACGLLGETIWWQTFRGHNLETGADGL